MNKKKTSPCISEFTFSETENPEACFRAFPGFMYDISGETYILLSGQISLDGKFFLFEINGVQTKFSFEKEVPDTFRGERQWLAFEGYKNHKFLDFFYTIEDGLRCFTMNGNDLVGVFNEEKSFFRIKRAPEILEPVSDGLASKFSIFNMVMLFLLAESRTELSLLLFWNAVFFAFFGSLPALIDFCRVLSLKRVLNVLRGALERKEDIRGCRYCIGNKMM